MLVSVRDRAGGVVGQFSEEPFVGTGESAPPTLSATNNQPAGVPARTTGTPRNVVTLG
ncbi:MAG TPA: hypothetical protein VFW09_04510 [Solirubrobacteraceae bacterium]|nr:hypothetical protein [Solirubrobacteraceae bacterium]